MMQTLPNAEPTATIEATGTRKRKRKRGSGKGVSGRVVPCANVGSSRVIKLFLRALAPKERGFALQVLLDMARAEQAKPANQEGGDGTFAG